MKTRMGIFKISRTSMSMWFQNINKRSNGPILMPKTATWVNLTPEGKYSFKSIHRVHILSEISSFFSWKCSFHSLMVQSMQMQCFIIFPVHMPNTNFLHWQNYTFVLFPLHFTTNLIAVSLLHYYWDFKFLVVMFLLEVSMPRCYVFFLELLCKITVDFICWIFLPVAVLYIIQALTTAICRKMQNILTSHLCKHAFIEHFLTVRSKSTPYFTEL